VPALPYAAKPIMPAIAKSLVVERIMF